MFDLDFPNTGFYFCFLDVYFKRASYKILLRLLVTYPNMKLFN